MVQEIADFIFLIDNLVNLQKPKTVEKRDVKMECRMINLISNAIANLNSFFKSIQVKRFLGVVLVGFFLLTTNVNIGQNKAPAKKVLDDVHQNDSQRPKTVGEWQNEKRQEDPINERVGQIGEQSKEAFKDFGKLYPDTAKRSARDVRDND